METQSLIGKVIIEILTPLCEPVNAAWINRQTTPIATSTAVLQLLNGELIQITPCEIELEPGKYPSLGLFVESCDSSALQWVGNGKAYSMQSLAAAAGLLPFAVSQLKETDPLGEGAVSEILLFGSCDSQLLFRHLMPPMTLGIEVTGGATNSGFNPDAGKAGAG